MVYMYLLFRKRNSQYDIPINLWKNRQSKKKRPQIVIINAGREVYMIVLQI